MRELGPVLCARTAAEPSMQNVLDVSGVGDDTEAIPRVAGVEHAMAGLDAGSHSDRSRTLEDTLGGFVVLVPALVVIAEVDGDALKVHLPGGIQSGVVEVGEAAHGGREVAGETDGSVKEVGEFGGVFVLRWMAFNLENLFIGHLC